MSGRANVRIRIEVEVEVGVWNDTESFGTLGVQAMKEAEQKVNNVCSREKDMRVVGSPKSMHVILHNDLS